MDGIFRVALWMERNLRQRFVREADYPRQRGYEQPPEDLFGFGVKAVVGRHVVRRPHDFFAQHPHPEQRHEQQRRLRRRAHPQAVVQDIVGPVQMQRVVAAENHLGGRPFRNAGVPPVLYRRIEAVGKHVPLSNFGFRQDAKHTIPHAPPRAAPAAGRPRHEYSICFADAAAMRTARKPRGGFRREERGVRSECRPQSASALGEHGILQISREERSARREPSAVRPCACRMWIFAPAPRQMR